MKKNAGEPKGTTNGRDLTRDAPEVKSDWTAKFLGFCYRTLRLDTGILYAALSAAVACFSLFLANPNHHIFERLGNMVIISGALLISKGVILTDRTRKYLFDVIEQEKNSKTMFLRETNPIRFYLRAIRRSNNFVPYENIRRMYMKRKRRLHSPGGVRKFIGQKMLAEILISFSDYGEAGTILVIIGTLCVAFNPFIN